jgi:hypothetical protein
MTGRRTAAGFDRSDPMPDTRMPFPLREARR